MCKCWGGPGGSMSKVVGSNSSYKPIINTAWVRAQLCKLQKRCTRLAAASDKVYQLLAQGRWFSPASSTSKTGRHDIAESIAESGVKHQKFKFYWILLLSVNLLIPRVNWLVPTPNPYEKFEYTKGVIRNRKSKNRQYNGQTEKDKRTNNDLQNTNYTENHRLSNIYHSHVLLILFSHLLKRKTMCKND